MVKKTQKVVYPLVSVVMSVYNGEKYVSEAVNSILNQTFTSFEFIIINDGSTDKTGAILKEFGQKDKRIRVVEQDNIGLTKSLNKAIHLSRGKYIARMDADDIALPERFEKQVKYLEENGDCGVVGTGYYIINANGKVIEEKTSPISDRDIKRSLLKGNVFLHASVMMRKEVLLKVGGYDENFKLSQDYDLWLRMSKHCKMHNLPEKLMVKRFDYNCLTITRKKEQSKYALRARIKAMCRGDYPLWALVYLLKPIIVSYIFPNDLTQIIRKKFLKSGKVLREI